MSDTTTTPPGGDVPPATRPTIDLGEQVPAHATPRGLAYLVQEQVFLRVDTQVQDPAVLAQEPELPAQLGELVRGERLLDRLAVEERFGLRGARHDLGRRLRAALATRPLSLAPFAFAWRLSVRLALGHAPIVAHSMTGNGNTSHWPRSARQ